MTHRPEDRINRLTSAIKDQCGEIPDKRKSVQCFLQAQDFEEDINEVLLPERQRHRQSQLRQQQEFEDFADELGMDIIQS